MIAVRGPRIESRCRQNVRVFREYHCDMQLWSRAVHLLQCVVRLSLPGLKIRNIFNCTQIERRRREGRGAEGAEGVGVWEGNVPLPIRLGGLGSVVSSPSGVWGEAPADFDFSAFCY